VRSIAARILRDAGHEVVEAENAAGALAVLETRQDFALLFSDIMMPGMSGTDLAEQIQRSHPNIGVLLTSGYAAELEGRDDFELLPLHSSDPDLAGSRCARSCDVSPWRACSGRHVAVPGVRQGPKIDHMRLVPPLTLCTMIASVSSKQPSVGPAPLHWLGTFMSVTQSPPLRYDHQISVIVE